MSYDRSFQLPLWFKYIEFPATGFDLQPANLVIPMFNQAWFCERITGLDQMNLKSSDQCLRH